MTTFIFFFLVVRCPPLLPPPNGFQLGCGAMYNVFGDKCRYFCDIGYRLINGSTERSCQADGKWSGETPHCQRKLRKKNQFGGGGVIPM